MSLSTIEGKTASVMTRYGDADLPAIALLSVAMAGIVQRKKQASVEAAWLAMAPCDNIVPWQILFQPHPTSSIGRLPSMEIPARSELCSNPAEEPRSAARVCERLRCGPRRWTTSRL